MSRLTISCALVLVMLATFTFGCGDDEGEEQKTTITVGVLTDLTGPAGPALVSMLWAMEDLVRYINEEDPIPGVKLKVIAYDGKMDPSRTIPGYEWLKGQGADALFFIWSDDAEMLRPFAEKEKIPLFAAMGAESTVEPPGWLFVVNYIMKWGSLTALEWLGEQWDTTEGVLKVGMLTYPSPISNAIEEAFGEYCQDHPDRFDYAGGFVAPAINMAWSGEVEKLKDCDYIYTVLTSLSLGSFVEQYRAKGYTAKFLGGENLASFWAFVQDKVGLEAIDGSICWLTTGWWSDPYPMVGFIKEILQKYRPGEAEEAIRAGNAYLGGAMQQYFFLQILRAAIEEVGAENLDGQALYDTAVKFKLTMEGLGEWGFSETRRWVLEHVTMYEVRAEAEDIVAVSDPLPVVKGD